ncbi:MAG: hypothetical protein K2V38_07660 [Gemmataceae bacterium]|nr:hypothetical protein [Gemmataceae bacterium]
MAVSAWPAALQQIGWSSKRQTGSRCVLERAVAGQCVLFPRRRDRPQDARPIGKVTGLTPGDL